MDDLEVVPTDTLNKMLEMQIRIEQLEVALRQLAETDLTGIAIKALGGKDG